MIPYKILNPESFCNFTAEDFQIYDANHFYKKSNSLDPDGSEFQNFQASENRTCDCSKISELPNGIKQQNFQKPFKQNIKKKVLEEKETEEAAFEDIIFNMVFVSRSDFIIFNMVFVSRSDFIIF